MELGHSPSLGAEDEQHKEMLSFPECDPSRMIWLRSNKRGSWNSKGKFHPFGIWQQQSSRGHPMTRAGRDCSKYWRQFREQGQSTVKTLLRKGKSMVQTAGESRVLVAWLENTPRETPSEAGALSLPLEQQHRSPQ